MQISAFGQEWYIHSQLRSRERDDMHATNFFDGVAAVLHRYDPANGMTCMQLILYLIWVRVVRCYDPANGMTCMQQEFCNRIGMAYTPFDGHYKRMVK